MAAGKRYVRLPYGRAAGRAPGDHGLVSGVEQLDLADGRAVAAEMPPVQAEAQEDADGSAAFGAQRLRFPAGVWVIDRVVVKLAEHGVAYGGEVHRQPQQASGGVLWREGGEPGDPVVLSERGDGAHGSHGASEAGS